ncbi:uncharacterized protein G2W53_022741 [Senna tora]|uniref:Uncharacterized protein n=1 Tax=Senna tora TaxID=362788 RepID=A0A834TN88_9FABA|nr:uncharacterized protein G2W53_022741 [Senna tora]
MAVMAMAAMAVVVSGRAILSKKENSMECTQSVRHRKESKFYYLKQYGIPME